jgi:hypothetical protein
LKRILIVLFLAVTLIFSPVTAVDSYAQTDAGFLDGPPPAGGDPYSVYDGVGWYCIQRQYWPDPDILIAGSFKKEPDCSAY